jgi:hypothetical protein
MNDDRWVRNSRGFPTNRIPFDEKHLDECHARANRLMELPLGQVAIEGMYYTEMFGWVFRELVDGRTPTGIPAKLMVE